MTTSSTDKPADALVARGRLPHGRISLLIKGLLAVAPLALGVAPAGLVYGTIAVQAGIPPWLAITIAWFIFAGSSQFVLVKLVGLQTPGLMMILAVGLVNLRHLLYAAALLPWTQQLSWRWKWILSYLLTDEAYAVTQRYLNQEHPLATDKNKGLADNSPTTSSSHQPPALSVSIASSASPNAPGWHWFMLGAGLGLWGAWQASCIIGVWLGGYIPATWSLDFAATLTFTAIVAPLLKGTAERVALLVAIVFSLLFAGLPYKLGLLLAASAGILVGVMWDRFYPSPPASLPSI